METVGAEQDEDVRSIPLSSTTDVEDEARPDPDTPMPAGNDVPYLPASMHTAAYAACASILRTADGDGGRKIPFKRQRVHDAACESGPLKDSGEQELAALLAEGFS